MAYEKIDDMFIRKTMSLLNSIPTNETVKKISKETNMAQGNVAKTLTFLAKEGLVVKTNKNGKEHVYILSEKGQKIIKYYNEMAKIFKEVGGKDERQTEGSI